jgi:hypothetical protein
MSQIRLGLFDLFGYIIPGIAQMILVGLALNLINLAQLQALLAALTLESSIAYIFLGYVIGFVTEGMAVFYVANILDRVRGKLNERVLTRFKKFHPETKIKNYDINFIYAFADVNSPKSVEKADTFFAMGSLARNLSFSFLLFGIISLVRNIVVGNVIWSYIVSIASLLFSLYLVFQADKFRDSSHKHLLNIYYIVSEVNNKDDNKSQKKTR